MSDYHGGKKRIGRSIADIISSIAVIIEDETGERFKGYCEPFVGMAGVLKWIPSIEIGERKPRLRLRAGDINESVIKMWQAAQKGWVPPTTCSEDKFYKLKRSKTSSAEKGFIGHQFAYIGVYLGTFDYRKPHAEYASSSIVSMAAGPLQNVKFTHGSYQQFSRLKGWIIYCDPPYFHGSHYKDENLTPRHLDYDHFYQWAMKMSEDNLVFVSERADLCKLLPRGTCELVGEFGSDEKLFLIM
jgi:site-specific DNA-adenine methylase